MAEIHIPYLPSAKFFKVLCRLGIHEQDIASDTDSNPQIRTIGGTVTISTSVTRFRYTEADGRARVVYNKPETYNIQTATGELFDADGNLGVYLLDTTSPGVDPQGWTYRATVRPEGGEPFDAVIPSGWTGEAFDLGDGLVFTPSTGITSLETRVKALEDAPSGGTPVGEVEQVTLTDNLVYTIPAGIAPNRVHSVVFTQDATGGHTVTYGGQPVDVELAPSAVTSVNFMPNGMGYAVSETPKVIRSRFAPIMDEDRASTMLQPSVTPSPATLSDPGGLRHPGWLSRDRATLFNWTGSPYVRYSLDNGATWSQNPNALQAGTQAVRDLADGEILVSAGTMPGKLYRSSGWSANRATATFTEVLAASNTNIYFHNSWSLHTHENIVLAAEYGSKVENANARYVYLSEDYGCTWRIIFDIGGTLETHVHGVAYDRWWNRIWVSRGDATCAIYYSDDMGATWTTVTDYVASGVKNQVTTIIPMAECVLFMSDSAPNGVLRARRRRRDRKPVIEVAYRLNTSTSITHIGHLAYQADYPNAPVLMSFTNDPAADYTGPGRLIATTDGFRFWEVWKDSIDYGRAGGLVTAVGPTTSGKYLGTLMDGRQVNYSLLTVTAPVWSVPEAARRYDSIGDETMPRWVANAEPLPVSGTLVLSYFRATQTKDVTLIRAYTGATVAAATTTLFRLGLYEVDGDGNLALVAGGVNDVTKIQIAWTNAGQAVTGARIVAGRTYAIGLLAVGPGQMPSLAGTTAAAGIRLSSGVFFMDPKLSAQVSGQEDLPATVSSASLAPCARIFWHAVI